MSSLPAIHSPWGLTLLTAIPPAPVYHLPGIHGSQSPTVAGFALASIGSLSLLVALLIVGIIAVVFLVVFLRSLLDRDSAGPYDNTQGRHRRSDDADVAGEVGATVLDTIAEAAKSVLGPRREREVPRDTAARPRSAITGAPAPKAPPVSAPAPQSPWAGSPAPSTEQKEEAAPSQTAPAWGQPAVSAAPQEGDDEPEPLPWFVADAQPAARAPAPAAPAPPTPPSAAGEASAPQSVERAPAPAPGQPSAPPAAVVAREDADNPFGRWPDEATEVDAVTRGAPEARWDESAGTLSPAGAPQPDVRPQPEPVHFTALYPKEVPVETWNTLLVYTHLASALPALRADALKFKDELGAGPRESHAQAGRTVARGTELTLVPTCEGVTFNPERVSFHWVEDLHRAEFRFQVGQERAGSAGNGEIAVYAGPLIVAMLKIAMLFDEPGVPPPTVNEVEVTAHLYNEIFVSYSRKDTPVVIACRNAYKALGIAVNMDVDSLRPGDLFDDTLMRLIDESDVFQLFWSERSAESEYVRQEWEYALRRNKGPGFIRPVYWEQPLVPPPPALARLHFAYVKLPELETSGGATT